MRASLTKSSSFLAHITDTSALHVSTAHIAIQLGCRVNQRAHWTRPFYAAASTLTSTPTPTSGRRSILVWTPASACRLTPLAHEILERQRNRLPSRRPEPVAPHRFPYVPDLRLVEPVRAAALKRSPPAPRPLSLRASRFQRQRRPASSVQMTTTTTDGASPAGQDQASFAPRRHNLWRKLTTAQTTISRGDKRRADRVAQRQRHVLVPQLIPQRVKGGVVGADIVVA
ncbi:hypothetical protein G3M48_002305 [Beauveria asiatica]|uniref:Uncharacterized protein n=1 Tax=Beauveria asiatica TaxID=1069075 RepID=A0AAW0RY82_9HYPO